MTFGAALFVIFPRQIFAIFAASDSMLKVGIPAFRIIAPHYILANFSILLGSIMQACKKEFYSLIPAITRQLVVLIPSAYIFSKFWGAIGVWAAFPFAELFSATITIILFKKTYNEQIATL